jgi:alkyl hydroperoxide reductase subunit AhpC
MSVMRRLICAVSLSGLWATWMVVPLRGDEPRLDRFEPDARQLLSDVVAVYRALPAIDADGELNLVSTLEGRVRQETFPLVVRYARPDKVMLANGPIRIVSDGKMLYTIVEPFLQYAVSEAPKAVTFDTLRSFRGVEPVFGGINGFPMFVLVSLVTEADAAKTLTMGASGMKLEADRKLDGRVHRCLFVDWPRGPGYRLLIELESKLVARIELVHATELYNEQAPPNQRLGQLEINWAAKSIKTGVPGREAFAFQAPKGFNKVAEKDVLERPLAPGEIRLPADAQAALMDEMKASEAMIGKPAPDFKVTVMDGPGKTKVIRSKDLNGRVVVVVVWPVSVGEFFPGEMAELPALAAAYEKAGSKVVFLFLPQDNLPGDPATIRSQVENAIGSKKLKLPVGDVGRVVLDPELAISRAFHATTLPTTVVIDGKGVVQMVDTGFMKGRLEKLRRKIDELLSAASR